MYGSMRFMGEFLNNSEIDAMLAPKIWLRMRPFFIHFYFIHFSRLNSIWIILLWENTGSARKTME